VAADPEFVIRNVLVANADTGFHIVVDDRRQLLHFMALRIDASNLIDIGDDVIEVVSRKIDNQIFVGHVQLAARFSPDAGGSCAAGCRPDAGRDSPS
jgi:hypothetical protein